MHIQLPYAFSKELICHYSAECLTKANALALILRGGQVTPRVLPERHA